jgi:hypothetical protein
MGIFDRFKKKTGDPEAERRRTLLQHGRITDGTILEGNPDGSIDVVSYVYFALGSDYESVERLTPEQLSKPHQYAPGAKVAVRFDPRQPGNSILV